MNITRRHVLKSMLTVAGVSSAALPLGVSATAVAEALTKQKSTVVVVSPDDVGQQFLSGFQAQRSAHIAQILNSSTDLSFIQQLQQVLQAKGSHRVVGLVDDASATLVMDLARSANAHLIWEGQHTQLTEAHAVVLGQAFGGDMLSAAHTANGRQNGGHHVSFMLEI